MDGDDLIRMVWLLLVAASVVGWLIVESRGRMGQMVRMALAWLLIITGLVGAWGVWDSMSFVPREQQLSEDGVAIHLRKARDGHFHATLQVDGTPIRFLVDTGASQVVLSRDDAERLGIDLAGLAWTGRARTANGTIRTAQVTLPHVVFDGISMGRVQASIGEGEISTSLLGMDFLNRFRSVQIMQDQLVLTR